MSGFIKQVMRFFQFKSELRFHDKFISTSIIKEALENQFRVITLEESTNHMRARIIKKSLLYSWLSLTPDVVDISFNKQESITTLILYFIWPRYYQLFALPIALIFLSINSGFNNFLGTLIIGFLFVGLILFLDSFTVSRTVLNILKKI